MRGASSVQIVEPIYTRGTLRNLAGPEASQFSALSEVKRHLGRKAQVGGGIIILFGVLLLAQAKSYAGISEVIHRLPVALIMLGILLFLAGTFARWLYLGKRE